MHGFHWIQGILMEIEAAAKSENLTEVAKVTIRRGQLSDYPLAELKLAWEMLTEGTICQGARLNIIEDAAVMECHGCGKELPWQSDLTACPICQGQLQLVSGTEVQLMDIQGT